MDASSVVSRDASRSAVPAAKINWCSGAEDWGDAECQFASPVVAGADTSITEDMENANDEPNGNVIEKMDNR